jgi:5,10-methylenetetrahydrofolate reductase
MGVQAAVSGCNALGIRKFDAFRRPSSSWTSTHWPHGYWDLDSVQLIGCCAGCGMKAGSLTNEDQTAGRVILWRGQLPNAHNHDFRSSAKPRRTNAGAQFFQTNLINTWIPSSLLEMMDKAESRQSLCAGGITPIRSVKHRNMMNAVPGVKIPHGLKSVWKSSDPKRKGCRSLELIEMIKGCCERIHFIAVGWESIVPRMVMEVNCRKTRNR